MKVIRFLFFILFFAAGFSLFAWFLFRYFYGPGKYIQKEENKKLKEWNKYFKNKK